MSSRSLTMPVRDRIPTMTLDECVDGRRADATTDTPFVIPRGLNGTPEPLWTPDALLATYPKARVPVLLDLPRTGVPYAVRRPVQHVTVPLAEFIAMLTRGDACYMNQVPLKAFPALARQFDLSHVRLSRVVGSYLWVGAFTRSGLHFDYADNTFAQIYGCKRVTLIDPVYSRAVYPYPDVPSKSRIDPEAPDLDACPLFARCTLLEYRLEPGDLLFIPKGWWHFLAAEDVSISVNCWHGELLTRGERVRRFAAAGPALALRYAWDFAWHGLLHRRYEPRLFSSPSLGLEAYRRVRDRVLRRASGAGRGTGA